MLATLKMWVSDPVPAERRWCVVAVGLCFWLVSQLCVFGDPGTPETTARGRARQVYLERQADYKKEPLKIENAWQFARACFDVADLATNSTERATIADQGIAACREVLARDPRSAAAHYYLGMNLGQLAQTRVLTALKLVDQMEHEFELASKLDENFDYAGPARNLGLLYREAPSIGSIGSRRKALRNLQRATEVAPLYPENGLNLIESCLKWNDVSRAKQELKALEDHWPRAKTNLVGAAWAVSWTDWTQRLAQAKKKIEESSKVLDTP
jgi:hypothetical protein